MADAYGWARGEILDTLCLDEAWYYIRIIKRRQLADYKMQVYIAHNEAKETVAAIEEFEKKTTTEEVKPIEEEKLDKEAFKRLIGAMSSNPRMVIKVPTEAIS